MKIDYDPETDTLMVSLSDELVEESDEVAPGVILDFDAQGRVLGVEILNVSRRGGERAATLAAVAGAGG
jgi:uncharacterized protein YuzE